MLVVPSALRPGPEQDLLQRRHRADVHPLAAGQHRVVGLGAPVPAAAGGLLGAREGRAEHDGVRAAGHGVDDRAGQAHAAVGDDVDVAAAGLVEVVPPGAGRVGQRRGHRGVDAHGLPGGVRRAAAEADEHARRAGAHEVQRGGVAGRAADDDGHVELVDEPLEVERLAAGGHVLGRHGGAADDEQVDPGGGDGLPQLLGALRAQRAGDGDAGGADLGEAVADQLGADRLGVDLLHADGGRGGVELGDLGQQRLGVLVPGPQALEVEHAEPAEAADLDRGGRAHHRVHRRGQQRQLEPVGVDLPGGRDVLGVAGAPRGHDGHVVQRVRPAAALGPSDLQLVHPRTLASARGPAGRGPGARHRTV